MIKVTAAVIEREGKVLIAQRKQGGHSECKWEFPGGKIESNETPEECLERELYEEFGINAEIGDFICSHTHRYSDMTIELLVYRVLHISGGFTLNDHEEIKWVPPEDLALYDFADADKPIVERLMRDISPID